MSEFDLRSSFFSRADLVEILEFPTETVLRAWDTLVPYFGSSQQLGFLRSTVAPNFFDVISIAAHCSLSKFAVDQCWVKDTSLSVSDLVATLIDEIDPAPLEEFSDPLGVRYRLKLHEKLVDYFELWASGYPFPQRRRMFSLLSLTVGIVIQKIRSKAIRYAIELVSSPTKCHANTMTAVGSRPF